MKVQNDSMRSCLPQTSGRRATGAACAALTAVLSLYGAVGAAQSAKPQRAPGDKGPAMYKWVDEQGVTHYGDAIPPQYANREKQVLNAQGVQVGTIAGSLTPEQAAQAAARRAEEDSAQAAVIRERERDKHLLATYLTVAEIENLRDRRFEILDGQARVTQQYLEHLRSHEHLLLVQVQHFQPYTIAANTGQMPDRLAEDLVRTESDIRNQQRNLDGKRQEAASMKAQFDSDIARFRELKKAETDQVRAAPPRS